jgi:hypothetical protein
MVCFQTKNPILGKFWMVLLLKILVYFMTIWSILRPLEIFYGHLAYFGIIWCIFPRIGFLYHEKSGNPGPTGKNCPIWSSWFLPKLIHQNWLQEKRDCPFCRAYVVPPDDFPHLDRSLFQRRWVSIFSPESTLAAPLLLAASSGGNLGRWIPSVYLHLKNLAVVILWVSEWHALCEYL